MPTTDDLVRLVEREVKKFRDEIDSLNDQLDEKDVIIDDLTNALDALVEAATAEVNEKGGGGNILARLSDARNVLKDQAPIIPQN